jgi:hypothetical protein
MLVLLPSFDAGNPMKEDPEVPPHYPYIKYPLYQVKLDGVLRLIS